MRGYRFMKLNALKDILAGKAMVNSDGYIHTYANNTFKKSKYVKCFWFFETIEDALASFHGLCCNANDFALVEFDFDECEVYEHGLGSYTGLFFSKSNAVREFTTLRIAATNLSDIYYLTDKVTYDEYGESHLSIGIIP